MAENKDNVSVESKPTHEHQPAQEATRHVDVCVIGAGLTGLTTAFLLKRKSKEVVVIEKQSCLRH